MSLVIKQTRVVEVPVNTITLAATCQQAMLIDATGQCVGSINAMPAFMPTLLEIDLATGRIKNWTVPSCEQLQDIADTSEIQRMSEGEYHHFMNDRLFRNAVPLEQATTPPQTDDGWVDESRMPYGYFDDERDPALLNSAPTLGSTSAPTQALESDAVTVASTADCAPPDQQHNPLEVFDEPNESDTALCPDVPDSFYAPAPCHMPDIELDVEIIPNERFDNIEVHFDASSQKWLAEMFNQHGANHYATSTQGKFEAIKNLFKKINLQGVYEVNRIASDEVLLCDAELYSYDGSRTLNADTVYMTQGADGAWSARMPNNRPVSAVIGIDGALTGLLKEMEGIQPEDAVIIETTDDEMRSRNKRRYAVTAKHAPVEASTAIPVDLPSAMPIPAPVADFDDSDSDSDTKLDVTVTTRDNGEYVATTGTGATYVRASSRDSAWAALKNLIKKCGIVVSDSAIVETTNDHDSAQFKRRFSIDTSFAEPSDSDLANDEIAYSGDTELPEPVAANADQIDIEEAIAEALARPEPVIDNDAPAPVSIVTELDLRPSYVMNQLIAVQQRQSDPIYSAFFTARGITEGGKLSSKGARLLANLSQAETTERAEQIIKNACELPEPPATYAEIVALINHAATQMQCLALMDRIGKHENTEERRSLFALQKERVDAFKADSAA